MNMQQDEAFLTLLSSQRQLLSQLNRESAMQKAGKKGTNLNHSRFAGNTRPRSGMMASVLQTNEQPTHDCTLGSLRRLSMNRHSDAYDQMLLPPFPISENNSGFGMMDCSIRSLAYPSFENESMKCKMMQSKDQPAKSEKYCEYDGSIDLEPTRKKRRLSSVGFGFSSPSVLSEYNCKTAKSQYGDGDHRPAMGLQNRAPGFHSALGPDNVEQLRTRDMTNSDHNQIARAMQNFTQAMEKSQKSQQDIHDWDRKMGLKRSHSKTMRLSSRSRKQLAAVLKPVLST